MSEPFDHAIAATGRRRSDRSRAVARRTGVRAWALAVVATAALACGAGDDGNDSSGEPANDGARLYAANCASCHGTDLRGTAAGPSHLSVVYEPGHHPDDSFRAVIRDGVAPHHWDFGPMPAIAGLDDGEIEAIVAFIRAAQEREGFEPYLAD